MARLLAAASAAFLLRPVPCSAFGGAVRHHRQASAVNASCTDAADWQDLDGDNCTVYSTKGWCGQWSQQWAETGSVSASEACCACGGGHALLPEPEAAPVEAPSALAAAAPYAAVALRGSEVTAAPAVNVTAPLPSVTAVLAVPAAPTVNVTALEKENEALLAQVQHQEAELHKRDTIEDELRASQALALGARDKEVSVLGAKDSELRRDDADLKAKDAALAAKEAEIQDLKGLVLKTNDKLRVDDARVRDVEMQLQNETAVNAALRKQAALTQNRTATGVSAMRQLAARTAEKTQSMDRQISALKAQLQSVAPPVGAVGSAAARALPPSPL